MLRSLHVGIFCVPTVVCNKCLDVNICSNTQFKNNLEATFGLDFYGYFIVLVSVGGQRSEVRAYLLQTGGVQLCFVDDLDGDLQRNVKSCKQFNTNTSIPLTHQVCVLDHEMIQIHYLNKSRLNVK